MKVFSVSGYSKTGKTTTINTIIHMLKEKGYKVAAIKDIHNENFTMEKQGSNTHIMQKAGAEAVFARGLKETYLITPKRMELTEMISLLTCDWLVIEGMKKEAIPRIITASSVEQLDELVDDTVMAVSGKISKGISDYKGLPSINCIEQPEKLLALIEEKVFDVLPLAKDECCQACGLTCYEMVGAILKGKKKREDCVLSGSQEIYLKIDGQEIKMVPFVRKLFYDNLHAFLSNLKGYKKGKIEIKISD